MRIFPSTKHEWFALFLFPFKAYVVVVYPFYRVFRILCPPPFLGTNVSDGTYYVLLQGFLLCGPALLVGALIQYFVSGRRYALPTLGFAVVPVVVLSFVLWSAYKSHLWIQRHAYDHRPNKMQATPGGRLSWQSDTIGPACLSRVVTIVGVL
jgi:hypothetical protein